MVIDLTNVKGRLNNVKRRLKLELTREGVRFYNVSDILLEITQDWHIRSLNTRTASGAPLYMCTVADIADSLDIESIIALSTAIGVNGTKYKLVNYNIPITATRYVRMELAPTGEMEPAP